MPRAFAFRLDFMPTGLPGLARRREDAAQAHRLLALAAIYDGGTRSEAALNHGVVRWRLCDLGQWLCEEFCVVVS